MSALDVIGKLTADGYALTDVRKANLKNNIYTNVDIKMIINDCYNVNYKKKTCVKVNRAIIVVVITAIYSGKHIILPVVNSPVNHH